MEREILKQIIADQREYASPKNFFERSQFGQISDFEQDSSIVILSGVRRSGKSTLLRMVQKSRSEQDYYLNFDDDRLIQFALEDFQLMVETFIELYGKQSTYYFDEIQNIPGWERFVRRLHDQGNKIYITGSNARLLSKELGTHLTGRYVQFEVFPLSYEEIVLHENANLLKGMPISTSEVGAALHLFRLYTEFGGIPEYVKFHKPEYLKNLYEGIIFRDIIVRHHIGNDKALRELGYYLASNIGKELSYTNLAESLGLGSPNTVSKYCSYLEDCYLCFFLSRYSHSVSKQIQSSKKCYMIDPAMIRLIGFRVSEDRGRLLENLVYLHLRGTGREVFFHKEKKECDFLIRSGNRIVEAIQVTLSLREEKVRNREFEGLLEALESYSLSSGLILTENEEGSAERDGKQIRWMPVWKWLLTK